MTTSAKLMRKAKASFDSALAQLFLAFSPSYCDAIDIRNSSHKEFLLNRLREVYEDSLSRSLTDVPHDFHREFFHVLAVVLRPEFLPCKPGKVLRFRLSEVFREGVLPSYVCSCASVNLNSVHRASAFAACLREVSELVYSISCIFDDIRAYHKMER